MITIFNRKELSVVFFLKEQSRIRQILASNKIDYRIKTINRMSSSSFSRGPRADQASFGQNMDLNYEYIFYVSKKDYQKAGRIINKG